MLTYTVNGNVERIKFAREAAEVKRCHTFRIHGEYNVGLHTHNMLSMLRILWKDAPIDLIWAIHEHDLPERLTGDIPAPSKWAGVTDPVVLNYYETIVCEMVFGSYSKIKLNSNEKNWLKGLDMLELFCWTKDQLVMGNTNVTGMKDRLWRFFLASQGYPEAIKDMFFLIKKDEWKLALELGDFDHGN